MTDTITLRYDGPARRTRIPAFDIDVGQGETVAVDPDATVSADDDETLPVVEWLTERRDFERVVPEYAVLDQPVDDLEDGLATGEHDAHLDALAHAEREGRNRSTALDAIHDRHDEVQEND